MGETGKPSGPQPVREALTDLVERLERLQPVAIYLFGSQASGASRPDSDLDLALLQIPGAPALSGPERLELIDELERLAGRQVDLVVLNRVPLPLQFEVIHTGKLLYESDPEARTDAEDLIVRDYLDLQPWYERSYRELLEEHGGGRDCSTSNS